MNKEFPGRMRLTSLRAVCQRLREVALIFLVLLPTPLMSQELERARPGYTWRFPRDHGSHPSYQTEWWYYTGQLYAQGKEPFRDKPEFGFQLTFFRRSELVMGQPVSEYMAHAALTDITSGKTYFSSRLGGGALGLATASSDSLGAASGDWTVDPIGKQLVLRFSVVQGSQPNPVEVRILTAELPSVWLQGVEGVSRKASCDGCSSMYYSMPRIALTASVGTKHDLHGVAWMDHEFMTNSIASTQVGWDWFGLMLKDGRNLMLFQLRNSGGGVDFSSAGVWRAGSGRMLTTGEFTITPERRWRSSATGAVYPVEWRIVIPTEGVDTVVRARVDSCEVGESPTSSRNSSEVVRYWEGPVAAVDESVLGYLEMTGYAGKVGQL
jgi:predicted secreted hydrolase